MKAAIVFHGPSPREEDSTIEGSVENGTRGENTLQRLGIVYAGHDSRVVIPSRGQYSMPRTRYSYQEPSLCHWCCFELVLTTIVLRVISWQRKPEAGERRRERAILIVFELYPELSRGTGRLAPGGDLGLVRIAWVWKLRGKLRRKGERMELKECS